MWKSWILDHRSGALRIDFYDVAAVEFPYDLVASDSRNVFEITHSASHSVESVTMERLMEVYYMPFLQTRLVILNILF